MVIAKVHIPMLLPPRELTRALVTPATTNMASRKASLGLDITKNKLEKKLLSKQ